jgi:hypothetical protein
MTPDSRVNLRIPKDRDQPGPDWSRTTGPPPLRGVPIVPVQGKGELRWRRALHRVRVQHARGPQTGNRVRGAYRRARPYLRAAHRDPAGGGVVTITATAAPDRLTVTVNGHTARLTRRPSGWRITITTRKENT